MFKKIEGRLRSSNETESLSLYVDKATAPGTASTESELARLARITSYDSRITFQLKSSIALCVDSKTRAAPAHIHKLLNILYYCLVFGSPEVEEWVLELLGPSSSKASLHQSVRDAACALWDIVERKQLPAIKERSTGSPYPKPWPLPITTFERARFQEHLPRSPKVDVPYTIDVPSTVSYVGYHHIKYRTAEVSVNPSSDRVFWFNDKPGQNVDKLLVLPSGPKSDDPNIWHTFVAVAWSAQTGKGLLFSGRASTYTTLEGTPVADMVLNMTYASHLDWVNDFEIKFEMFGIEHIFECDQVHVDYLRRLYHGMQFARRAGRAVSEVIESNKDFTRQLFLLLESNTQAKTNAKPQPPNRHVRALYDFVPQEPGELQFQKGDVLKVTGTRFGAGTLDKQWLDATLRGDTGIIPRNYVIDVPDPNNSEMADASGADVELLRSGIVKSEVNISSKHALEEKMISLYVERRDQAAAADIVLAEVATEARRVSMKVERTEQAGAKHDARDHQDIQNSTEQKQEPAHKKVEVELFKSPTTITGSTVYPDIFPGLPPPPKFIIGAKLPSITSGNNGTDKDARKHKTSPEAQKQHVGRRNIPDMFIVKRPTRDGKSADDKTQDPAKQNPMSQALSQKPPQETHVSTGVKCLPPPESSRLKEPGQPFIDPLREYRASRLDEAVALPDLSTKYGTPNLLALSTGRQSAARQSGTQDKSDKALVAADEGLPASYVASEEVVNQRRSSFDLSKSQPLASRLNGYFPHDSAEKKNYSDLDIRDISHLLGFINPRWSKVPRTYVVMRMIGSLELLDSCIDLGFSDYWFPVTERSLPDLLRPTTKAAFVDTQNVVMTKSLDLEKGENGRHCNFRKGDALPLESQGILGAGGYGQVDRVLSLITFREYARKRVPRAIAFKGRRKDDVKLFIAEIEILKRLKHRHVVEFIGSYTDSKHIGLLMTPIAQGDLATYMSSATIAKYAELRTFFGCLATGLSFLHASDVRHKDIKPRNILIHNGVVRFTDFGLALDFTDATGSTTMGMVNGMTERYCAPEVRKRDSRNTASDIWCLGIVFLEMINTLKGKDTNYMDGFFKEHGTNEMYVSENLKALPDFVKDLAALGQWSDVKALDWTQSMLSEKPQARPTAAALALKITTTGQEDGGSVFCGVCCAEDDDFASEDDDAFSDK